MIHSLSSFCRVGVCPPTVIDDAAFEQYMRQPVTPDVPGTEYRILLDVKQLQRKDVKIKLYRKGEVEIRIRHAAKSNLDGSALSRDCCFMYELPECLHGKMMSAEWSEDGCLVIQASSGDLDEDEEHVDVIPRSTASVFKTTVKLGYIKDILNSVQSLAQQTLNYMKFYTDS